MSTQHDDHIGISEIAILAGCSKQAVSNWRNRYPSFPDPLVTLAAGPVFSRAAVVRWLKDTLGHVPSKVQERKLAAHLDNFS